MPPAPDGRWTLSQPALEGLLKRIDSDPEAAAREYELIRRKLVDFFDLRRAPSADALADETIDRVARKLEEGENVDNLRAYFYGVARRVLLESKKRTVREELARGELRAVPAADPLEMELRVRCLERSLRTLPQESRELIIEYYTSAGAYTKSRQRMAARLGLTYATLKTRIHRIRLILEERMRRCLEAQNFRNQ